MMQKLLLAGVAVLALTACGQGGGTQKADGGGAVVLIDGSSTVYPISEAIGEEFQKTSGTRVTIGLSGTGGGFKKFCRGETDISGASRPIKEEEIALCRENGVEFIELPVALDALAVIVHPGNSFVDCLSVDELKTIWQPSAQGKVTNWNQVRPGFPNLPIKLFGAGTDSGTFDYFTKAVSGEEGASRGDYTATEDDNVTVTGVAGDPGGLGYLGLAYFTENAERVKAVPIRQPNGACVAPSVETARNAAYQPLSRPLFYYVNSKHVDERPHLRAFIEFAFDATHSEPLVAEVGYVPLPTQAYSLAAAKVQARRTGTFFEGGSKIGVTAEELLADAGGQPAGAR
ncbi:MAG: PstS family phosphate ABC transporter substrate-binding protein [Phenylobacterium sp.]|uniref:PstS family phosphate ABC transporter substrate-binding protein n=1 Tax=Phenylobacterium sp. TaxID=1871053 RepID=UPI0039194C2F